MRLTSLAAVVCVLLSALFFAPGASAQTSTYTETVLHSFCAQTGCPDGEQPAVGLMQASDGNFYGVTSGRYDQSGSCTGCGTVFRISPSGEFATVYTFCSLANCADGVIPMGGLIEGGDGNLYGTTMDGGTGAGGDGTVFKLTFGGLLTTLANFSIDTGPELPMSALVQGNDGNYYGTTPYGGDNNQECSGCGTVFRLTPSGTLTQLYEFCSGAIDSCPGGAKPTAKLVQGTDGQFYGTTPYGVELGDATIFKVTSAGNLTTLLYPPGIGATISALVEGPNDRFYGVDDTSFFEVTSTGTLTTLAANTTLSGDPFLASDGNFYESTTAGTSGSVVQLTPSGTNTPVYTFCPAANCPDGSYPTAGVIQGADGALYGVTEGGGAYNEGTIYKISATPALAGPVQVSLSETSIAIGQSVTLNWSVSNAFSLTMQQCYAHVQPGVVGAGTWSGLQTGTMVDGILSGSATITPTQAGAFTYGLTCGGVESGIASVSVGGAKLVTVTSLMANSPVTLGSDAVLTTTVNSQQSTTPLTGTVTFSVNNLDLGTINLVNGAASLHIAALNIPASTYAVTANYSGDSNYLGSSATTNVVVQGYATKAGLTFSPSPVTQGQPVTLSATVSRTGVAGSPTGTMSFLYEGVLLGTAKLNGGVASLAVPTNGLPAGTYPVTAAYSGDASDQPATSPETAVTVLAQTTTRLTLSPYPVPANQAVTFSVQVTQSTGASVPTGSVAISVNGFVLGAATLDGAGMASVSVSTQGVPAGSYVATAAYAGDALNAASSASVPFSLQ